VTVAVKVTGWWWTLGCTDEERVVVVVAFSTVREAVAVLPVPWSELTVTELVFTPAEVAVTFTENVQEAPAARVPPPIPTVPAPGPAVSEV
jgi:hypothetical protein